MQRAGEGSGVAARPAHGLNLRPGSSRRQSGDAYGLGCVQVAEQDDARTGRASKVERASKFAALAGQRPNSNTISTLTETELSPGEIAVSFSIGAAAIIRITGIGPGWPAPPSLMLTMRFTCRPSARA